ncbi:MAG: TCR/Tet family MFS transporter [Hyphomicrobiales bacterium]
MTARPPGRHAIAFVFITVMMDMIGYGLVMPVLPRMIEEVGHLDLAAASVIGGWMYFAYGAMQFLFGPAVGNLSDAYGRRPLLLLAVFGLSVDFLFTAVAPTLFLLFVGRVVAGICGASYTIANAYLADITRPEERAKVFGLMGAAFGLGFVIGPAIGGLLGEFGPRVPFYVAATLTGLNFIFGYVVLPETLPPEKRRPFSLTRSNPLGALLVFGKHPGVLPLAILMFAYFAATSVYPAIWAFWGIARFGWSEAVIGLTLAAFGLITAVMQGAFTGFTVSRLGERNTVVFGLAASIIAAAGYAWAPSLLAVMVLLVIHAPEGFVHPALTAIMSRSTPEDAQGELQGGIASVQSVAMLIGTVFYAQAFGFFMQPGAPVVTPSAGYVIAAILLTMILAVFLFVRPDRART